MAEDFIVIDDVVSSRYQDLIEHVLTKRTAWFQYDNIVATESKRIYFGATRLFVGPNVPNDKDAPYFYCLLTEGFEKAGLEFAELNVTNVLRILASYTLPGPDITYGDAHIDDVVPHLVVIYYVTDSDGDTVITTSTFDGNTGNRGAMIPHGEETTVLHRVSPREGPHGHFRWLAISLCHDSYKRTSLYPKLQFVEVIGQWRLVGRGGLTSVPRLQVVRVFSTTVERWLCHAILDPHFHFDSNNFEFCTGIGAATE